MTLLETFFPELYVEKSSCSYNIVRSSESEMTLEINVAGIPEELIDVELSGNRLTVSASIEEDKREYFYKGIHSRSFKTSFTIKDGLVVRGATVKNGILSVQLEYEIPEEKKPRKILISH